MKAGKLAILPLLSCPYNKHMFVDLPSSVTYVKNIQPKLISSKLYIYKAENVPDPFTTTTLSLSLFRCQVVDLS